MGLLLAIDPILDMGRTAERRRAGPGAATGGEARGILDLDRYNAVEVIEVLDDDAAVVRAGYVVPAE